MNDLPQPDNLLIIILINETFQQLIIHQSFGFGTVSTKKPMILSLKDIQYFRKEAYSLQVFL